MGRTSKFSFPLPGRRHGSKEKEQIPPKSPSGLSVSGSSNRSKAQRILGTDDLCLDSPTRTDAPWGYPSSRSSVMSISISESTHSARSTNDTGSLSGSIADLESGVFPRAQPQQLHGKASSLLLGGNFEEEATDTSSLGRRMRHEGSDSTLKSYYDRQKSPLSVSQQTSESSARDLALRKGQPQILRSPLLQVESTDPFEEQFREPKYNNGDLSRDSMSKKKPARLDLTKLFPKARRSVAPPSINSPAPGSIRESIYRNSNPQKKLMKQNSKESLQSQRPSIRSTHTDHSSQGYDRHDQYSTLAPMDRIGESEVAGWEVQERGNVYSNRSEGGRPTSSRNVRPGTGSNSSHSRRQNDNTYLHPKDSQPFSWKNVRSSMASPNVNGQPWESSSAASISSRNTKTSRHSNNALSHTDLKQSSVLSLSDSSDGESSDDGVVRAVIPTGPLRKDRRHSRGLSGTLNVNPTIGQSVHRGPEVHLPVAEQPKQPVVKRQSTRKGAAHASPFLSIPEASFPNPRISGPWSPPDLTVPYEGNPRERKSLKKPAQLASTLPTSLHPTPPLSPRSIESRETEQRNSGRYMAVTKQEEALLEALRQKRARMKEKIIEEHEIGKSPPRVPARTTSKMSKHSKSSSIATIRGPDGSSNKGNILLYLDTPIANMHPRNTSEPSPDLSDFLTFGSDEDSTPRASLVPSQKDRPRPDSYIRSNEKISPMTPPSAARLSAVGATGGFRDRETRHGDLGSRKRREYVGVVRFVDDGVHTDDNDSDVIWGM